MKEISLTQGKVTLVDDGDYETLARFKWHAHRQPQGIFYAERECRVHGRQKTIKMHQVIMQAKGIDHWDGDGLNNQRSNLRVATTAQNQANRVRLVTNTSGRRGVSWSRKMMRWRARIGVDGSVRHLGFFDDLDEAARVYDTAARQFFGEFARLNFPALALARGEGARE